MFSVQLSAQAPHYFPINMKTNLPRVPQIRYKYIAIYIFAQLYPQEMISDL